eukprot:124384_1
MYTKLINLILVLSLTISYGKLIPLTTEWRNKILDGFNMYRRKIATGKLLPSANNMNALKWDYDLEQSLIPAAKTCSSSFAGAQLGHCKECTDEQMFNDMITGDRNAAKRWIEGNPNPLYKDEGAVYKYSNDGAQCCRTYSEEFQNDFNLPAVVCKDAMTGGFCENFFSLSSAEIDSIGCAIQDCREETQNGTPWYQMICNLKKGDTKQINFIHNIFQQVLMILKRVIVQIVHLQKHVI